MARAATKKSSPKKAKASPVKAKGGKAGAKAGVSKAGKSPRKQKKQKDPNAPKRAMSAYMFWLKENRGRLTKPGMSVTDVSKAAGVEWNKLSEKSKWNNQAAQDKKRYEREIASYKKK
jgi:structure-specific recognition protein 1